MEIPKLKKKISSFLTKEDGKISKEKLVKTGVLIASLAIASQTAQAGTTHGNSLSIVDDGTGINTGTHGHHASHSSY